MRHRGRLDFSNSGAMYSKIAWPVISAKRASRCVTTAWLLESVVTKLDQPA